MAINFELNARKWLTISQGFVFNLAFFTCFISSVFVSPSGPSVLRSYKGMTFNRKKANAGARKSRKMFGALNAIKFKSAEN